MAFSRVQIISHALTLMGRKPVSSLINQGDLVNCADQAFDLLLTTALSTSPWRFASTIAVLNKLNETPIGGYWKYSYALPSDYLKLLRLYPQTYIFELFSEERLYSNIDNSNIPFYIEYIYKPDDGALPSYFVKYFAFELASYLALSSAQVPDYIQELERRRVIQLSIAQAADAQNRPQTPIQSHPMVSRRSISAFAMG
jgi:hypothetical protein